jgi:hypothetical protein
MSQRILWTSFAINSIEWLILKTQLWHFFNISLCILKLYTFSHSCTYWRHDFKNMNQCDDKLGTIMTPVKLKSELYIVLCIRRGCVWLVMSGVKWPAEQQLNMLRILSARWPFRKDSTRWDVGLVYLFKSKNGKAYVLYKDILYDFAYPMDLNVCSILIDSYQCKANYTMTSHRITCDITFS